jgi:alkylation response protein AidB-like acyl-CoA dehydrogenase
VYAKTDFEKDAHPHKALTALIVDRVEGVNVEYIYGLMGSRGGGAARVVFKDVKVPKKNVIGKINGAYDVFNTMMIPERLGSAAMALGAAVPALEVATGYTTRRKAFGTTINNFQGVNFQVAEAATQIDAARSIIYMAAKAVDSGMPAKQTRRIVSEAKKFTTEAVQKAVHHAMQVMGGIGYTNIFPVERISRDLRLSSIWTGSNEVMSMIIAHEWYKEYAAGKQSGATRDLENDAAEADAPDEKIYG